MFRSSLPRLASALAALVLTLPSAIAQDVLNGIAAVVNDEVITFSQVRELVGAKEQSARQQYQGETLVEKIKEIRLQAINDLIDRQIILQEFKKQKFQIPDYFLNDRVNTIVREEFGGDRQAFVRTIEAQGFTLDRFKEMERDKIIVQEMTRSAVKQNIIVPESKILEAYKENISEFSTDEEIKLRMIAIKKGESSASRRRLTEEIRSKIMDGAEFGEMAHMYSDHTTQDQYGDWGWINKKVLNEDLTKAAFSLKAGEVSRVLDIGDTYYLLFAEAKKTGTQRPFKEVRDEIEKRLIQMERQKLREEWLTKLRKKAFIKMY
jgi:peptidyl-prolyl cis-trans isomerase SurA